MYRHLINVFVENASLYSSTNRSGVRVEVPVPIVAGVEEGWCRGRGPDKSCFNVQKSVTFSSSLLLCVFFFFFFWCSVLTSGVPILQGRGCLWSHLWLLGLNRHWERVWSPQHDRPSLHFLWNVSTRKQKRTQRGSRRRAMNYSSPSLRSGSQSFLLHILKGSQWERPLLHWLNYCMWMAGGSISKPHLELAY